MITKDSYGRKDQLTLKIIKAQTSRRLEATPYIHYWVVLLDYQVSCIAFGIYGCEVSTRTSRKSIILLGVGPLTCDISTSSGTAYLNTVCPRSL